MGIAPYKTFTFDGESSGDYGVYITGTGVFNAPERSVEMVEIAGRNGSFALDKGKFENIEVTYRVGIVDDSEADFADRVSDFRNWLCSKVGYCRLEDEYNPNEYRMAVYASGMELEHDLLIAGEAEITFNCKPQRWLTSGETAVSVADGGTIDNPTLFESEPLLAVEGYGNINFNGYDIDIENAVLGDVILAGEQTLRGGLAYAVLNPSKYNVGDDITVNGFYHIAQFTISDVPESSISFTQSNDTYTTTIRKLNATTIEVATTKNKIEFDAGTYSSENNRITITVGFSTSRQIDIRARYKEDPSFGEEEIEVSALVSGTTQYTASGKIDGISVYSTISTLGDPTYIDCDIGECYMIKNGQVITLNNVIDLGSDLPKLGSGENTINYDNTITDFKVTPRWWKV